MQEASNKNLDERERQVRRLIEAMPVAAIHREALKVLQSDFTYACSYQDGSWVALVRFGRNIEAMFGLAREVLVLYSNDVDLQPRLFRSFPDRLARLPRSKVAEDHVLAISSRDPGAAAKLQNWSNDEAFTAFRLPLFKDGMGGSRLILLEMKQCLSSRNLYDITLPVTGRDFFGRRRLLTHLQEELRQGNVFGVFGLRKTGKTSLIQELRARYVTSEASRIFVLRDLETLPKDSPRLGREFVQDLRQAFLQEFRPRNIRTGDLTNLTVEASVGDLRRALQTSITDCKRRGIRIVLALDEVEYFVGDSDTLREGNRPEVPEILGALRSLVQENANFNVIFSGITSAIIHRGDLYGVENPMFSWAQIYYVPPMSRIEINGLTTEVGNRMAVTWEQAALDAVHDQSRGHIFLHRTLAAKVLDRLVDDSPMPVIRHADVQSSLRAWRLSIAERLHGMLKAFERHYPNEASVLGTLMRDYESFSDVEGAFPAEVNRLLELALLTEGSSGELEIGALGKRLMETGAL